jgi:hypothetical protein
VSNLLHETVYVFLHNLLNVPVQIANKMGLQKKIIPLPRSQILFQFEMGDSQNKLLGNFGFLPQ